jgi:hypothetical protein
MSNSWTDRGKRWETGETSETGEECFFSGAAKPVFNENRIERTELKHQATLHEKATNTSILTGLIGLTGLADRTLSLIKWPAL